MHHPVVDLASDLTFVAGQRLKEVTQLRGYLVVFEFGRDGFEFLAGFIERNDLAIAHTHLVVDASVQPSGYDSNAP